MEDFWTLDQALGWVRWRDLRVVAALENDFYGAMCMWPPSKADGGMFQFVTSEVGTPADLLKALRTAKISARARKNGQGDREDLSAKQWQELRLCPHPLRQAGAEPDDGGHGSRWSEFRFSSEELQNYFRADASKLPKKKNAGQGVIDDKKLLIEMRNLLMTKKATSVREAARIVADRASGTSLDSKIDRLRRKYSTI